MNKSIISQIVLVGILSLIFSSQTYGQRIATEFGKNRVQYHNDFRDWLMYESPNFMTYWYGKSRNIAHTVVQIAEYEHDEIQDLMEHRINDKMEIIVFTDLSDLKQSNIGLEEAFVNDQFETKVDGSKIFIYFNGDHQHLRRQIREGIAGVYLNAMLYGSNIQEIVQNAIMNNLPPWFTKGVVAFAGEEWNSELDNHLKDFLLGPDKKKNFDRLSEINPRLAGQSLWYYISKNYSYTTISNLLYLTRINRSVDNGFVYVLGLNFDEVCNEWLKYYLNRYQEDQKNTLAFDLDQALPLKNKHKAQISHTAVSPDGRYLAYVSNEVGKAKVWLHDFMTGKNEQVFKMGFKNSIQATDYNYPHIAWHPNSQDLGIVYEKRDKLQLLIKNTVSGDAVREELPPLYERILDMDFVSGMEIAFTAIVNGYSDLFIFQTNTRSSTRITNDFYDDLELTVGTLHGMKGILFTSNRVDSLVETMKLDTILPLGKTDVFFYPYKGDSNELVRVTNTPFADEYAPVLYDSSHFSFLTNKSGIINRSTGYLKTVLAYHEQVLILKDMSELTIPKDSIPGEELQEQIDSSYIRAVYKPRAFIYNQTNVDRNIQDQHANVQSNKTVETIFKEGKYWVFEKDKNIDQKSANIDTKFQKEQNALNTKRFSLSNPKKERFIIFNDDQKEPKKEPQSYWFQTEFNEDKSPDQKEKVTEKTESATEEELEESGIYITRSQTSPTNAQEKSVMEFRPSRIIPYRLKFRSEKLNIKVDNELLFEGLETFAGNGNGFNLPPAGILFKSEIKDLFEDYIITLGARYPTTFNGSEYFVVFDNNKKLIDKRFAIYRFSQKQSEVDNFINISRTKTTTLIGMNRLKYPLDLYRSIRLTSTLRLDQFITQATELPALQEPTVHEQRLGAKVDYVFDNTINIMPNIMHGTRYKLSAEFVKRFETSFTDGFFF